MKKVLLSIESALCVLLVGCSFSGESENKRQVNGHEDEKVYFAAANVPGYIDPRFGFAPICGMPSIDKIDTKPNCSIEFTCRQLHGSDDFIETDRLTNQEKSDLLIASSAYCCSSLGEQPALNCEDDIIRELEPEDITEFYIRLNEISEEENNGLYHRQEPFCNLCADNNNPFSDYDLDKIPMNNSYLSIGGDGNGQLFGSCDELFARGIFGNISEVECGVAQFRVTSACGCDTIDKRYPNSNQERLTLPGSSFESEDPQEEEEEIDYGCIRGRNSLSKDRGGAGGGASKNKCK